MQCKKFQNHLLEAVDGTLSAELCRALESHLAQCTGCREFFDFSHNAIAALRRTPQRKVPAEIWDRIGAQIAQDPSISRGHSLSWWERLSEVFAGIPWGQKMAWSSVLTAMLVTLTVWGVWDLSQPAKLRVVDLAANPVTAFPYYVREHHNPASQPISEGSLVLAFNTLGERQN